MRGSIALSQASAGGKLEVLLLAKRRLAGSGGSSRLYLKAGRLSFTVPLKRAGPPHAEEPKKLPLTVQIVVTPPGRAALTLKKGVVLHV